MKFYKAFLFTLLYIIFTELIWLWYFLLLGKNNIPIILKNYDFINSLICLTLFIVFFSRPNRKDVLSLKKTTLNFILLGVLLGIGFVFFQMPLNILYYFDTTSNIHTYEFTLERLYSLNSLSYIILMPIVEELFFRNYLQRALTEKYKPYLAIFFASLLFSCIHLQLGKSLYDISFLNLHDAYITFFGGFISGVLLYKSKSIVPSILFHIFWNLTINVV
ncbi:MAG: lysostaphin resistance A-like protein [Kordia sp.]